MTATKRTPRASAPRTAKTPNEIAPGVFLGNWDDAVKFVGTRFCVLDDAPEEMPPSTHVRIYDEKADRADVNGLDRVVAGMKAARAKGDPVLVYCGHGIYRSPLAAAWYLKRTERVSLDEAYRRITALRPKAKPAAGWLGNVAELNRA